MPLTPRPLTQRIAARKPALATSLPALGAGLLALANPAFAAQTDAATGNVQTGNAQTAEAATQPAAGGIGDIVVTAQKREQLAQNVGIALSAISGRDLERLGLLSPAQIPQYATGVQLAQPNGTGS